jgi:signal transduction histidine kinase
MIVSERALVLAPRGRDAAVAAGILGEAAIKATICPSPVAMLEMLDEGAGFVVVTEEAIATADLRGLADWIEAQEEWSDLPFILLTTRGGGLERNPAAARHLEMLGNVTFVERPFHPTTLISLARAAIRGRRRQYEARARLLALRELNDSLGRRVADALTEREQALAQLHEAQKLETIGQLTGGVAHDFNNLLTPITGALDLLGRRYGDDARSSRLIDGALQSAERAKTLVQRLLQFARRQPLETRPVDVAALIEGMRDLIASSIGGVAELKIIAPAALAPALADPNQLELAILNLCVNARDAMPDGGVLTLALEQVLLGPRSSPALTPGGYLRLSVIDTGIGMDEVTLARAVEPFYSTKERGKGTGLGLSMVHGLAAQLGGTFVMTSVPGHGTRADVYLPIATARAESVPRRLASETVSVNCALSLLLVDDEELVRVGTAEMLRDMGHRVTVAASGGEALKALEAGLSVDAVVTDYMMPRMNGGELAAQIHTRSPELPVLIVTGYAGGSLDLHLPQLAKPFRQADLAVALAQLTDPGKIVRITPRAS